MHLVLFTNTVCISIYMATCISTMESAWICSGKHIMLHINSDFCQTVTEGGDGTIG